MPFGLSNCPSMSQRTMNVIFKPYLDKFVMVYMDDILIFSKTAEEHLQHIRLVLAKLKEYKFYIRFSKCTFGRKQLEFLGHHLSGAGIRPSPSKVKVVADWQPPKDLKELRVFLGFTNYYRKFVPRFSHVAQPLNDRTKKDWPYVWTHKCQTAFETLRQALIQEPVLVLPKTGQDATFVLSTDSSAFALGATLLQDQGHGLQPVEYYARSMNSAERNYGVHEQELLAVVAALKHWRHYLEGCKHFLVTTDHSTLKHFMTQPTLSRRQTGWLDTISPYATHMDIFYRRGETNQSDGLSRRSDLQQLVADTLHWETISSNTSLCQVNNKPLLRLSAILSLKPSPFVQEILAGYKSDPMFATTPAGCTKDSKGLYRLKGRVAVPNVAGLKLRMLQHFHDELGHYGVVRTEAHLKQHYWWKGMGNDVLKFVTTCPTCQLTKHGNTKPSGLLSPMPVPTRPFEVVGMDFVVQLPNSNGYDAILTFTCLYSKMVHLVPTTVKVTAQQVAKLYLHHIYRLYGLTSTFVSDRDSKFTSAFWGAFTQLINTKLNMSTAYRAQTDGQSERTNQTMEQVLRCFCYQRHDSWADYLDVVEFCINLHKNSSTQFSPFEVMYGYQPHTVGTLQANDTCPSATQLLADREAIRKLVVINLQEAKEFQKHYADKKLKHVEFALRDRVSIDTAGLALAGQPGKAFKQRWIGPFTVSSKLSPLVYRLDLPPAMNQVHPVFHISKLRLWKDDTVNPQRYVSEAQAGRHADVARGEYFVDCITDCALGESDRFRTGDTLLFKVRWLNYDSTHDSWEPYSNVRQTEALTIFMQSAAWKRLSASAEYQELARRWPARVPRTA